MFKKNKSAFFALLLLSFKAIAQPSGFSIEDPAFLKLVDTTEKLEKVAGGFGFLEGPVWSPDGYLLFSDLRVNKIFQLIPGQQAHVFLEHSGYVNDAPRN